MHGEDLVSVLNIRKDQAERRDSLTGYKFAALPIHLG